MSSVLSMFSSSSSQNPQEHEETDKASTEKDQKSEDEKFNAKLIELSSKLEVELQVEKTSEVESRESGKFQNISFGDKDRI